MEKNWQPNEIQTEFINILKENPDGITLVDIEIAYGKKFATGSINTLASKGIVDNSAEVKVACDVVYNKADGSSYVVGHTTKTWKVYKLVNKE